MEESNLGTDILQTLLKLPAQYPYECLGLLAILIYIQIYFLGNSTNKKIGLKFVNSTFAYFKNNFAHVGVTKQENGPLLTAESSSSFKFFASGRLNIHFMMISIELKKRQDLLSTTIFSFIWPERDTLQIDIPLSCNPQPIAFAIVRKKDAKTYKENNIDLKYLCEKVSVEKVEDKLSMVCLGEGREPLNSIFDSKIVAGLQKYEKHISFIHFTDQKNLYQNPQHLRASFINLDQLQGEDFIEITNIVLQIADKLAFYKLPAQLKSANEEERAKLEEIKQKDEKLKKIEEAQKRKTEKILKEKQKIYSLPREQQLKMLEKEKKDELKKKYQKRTMHM